MTTSIDTNVLLSLWDRDPSRSIPAQKLLGKAAQSGALVICAPVYAELFGDPARDEQSLGLFLSSTGIRTDYMLDEEIWLAAAHAFRGYVLRRKKSSNIMPRRILTDFIIGAHALVRGYSLLTFDIRLYRAAFPKLKMQSLAI